MMKRTSIWLCILFLFFPTLHAEKIAVGVDESAIIATVSKKDYILGLAMLLNEFLKGENMEATVTSYDDPAKLAKDLESGKIDMVTSDARSIVENFSYADLKSGITGHRYGKNEAHTLLTLERIDDSRPLSEKLKGKIATSSQKVIDLYVRTLMLENRLPEAPDYLIATNSQQSILKLFFKKADIAFVDQGAFNTACELNPQLQKEIRIVQSTTLTLGPVSFFRRDYPKSTHEKVLALIPKINSSERGKQMLRLFKGDSVNKSTFSDLEGTIALKKHYDSLNKHASNLAQGNKK